MDKLDKVIKSIEDCVFQKIDCVDCLYDGCVFEHGNCKRDLLADALELLKEKPQIVRCKDCRFSEQGFGNAVWCKRYKLASYEKWFCADGELADGNVTI